LNLDVASKECVDDARTAIRWFRQKAADLGVDPDKIVASGGSMSESTNFRTNSGLTSPL
jgi:carboxylesterase type B